MSTHRAQIVWQREGKPFVGGEYSRSHCWRFDGGIEFKASASPQIVPAPQGESAAVDPEEAFVASLSSCHMLWYLGLAAASHVTVTDYVDSPTGVMTEQSDGSGQFVEVTLAPVVTVAESSMVTRAEELHAEAAAKCFIARSVNVPVRHNPTTRVNA